MKTYRITAGLVLLILATIIPTSITLADEPLALPVQLEGEIKGARFVIHVPENWNGTLLLYAHGYSSTTVDDPDAAFPGSEDLLLAHGYALAASGFRNAGWNVEEGIQDTQRLLIYFRQNVAHPQRVIVYGMSMGTAVALKSIEKYHGFYDGAVPICSVGIGGSLNADLKLDYTVSYAAAFGWQESWGEIGDLKSGQEGYDVYWDVLDDVSSNFAQIFGPDPEFRARFEFMRLVNDMPVGGFYQPTPHMPGPGAMLNMMLGYYLRYELEQRAGGPVAQNANHVYSLSESDRIELRGAGMTDAEMNELLATMNGMANIEARRSARQYLSRFDWNGHIKVPVLMLHNREDPLTPVEGTTVYYNAVADRGNEDLLLRVYTDRPGHCNVTPEQVLTLFQAMDGWLDTGTPPEMSAFPTDLEFVTDFVPGPWPQPPGE